MKGLTEARIVHYVLTEQDVKEILRRRTDSQSIKKRVVEETWPKGAQAHIGNEPAPGDHCAMVIVRVWSDSGTINGQVLLDGTDSLWVTSRAFDAAGTPGTWHWPAEEIPDKVKA